MRQPQNIFEQILYGLEAVNANVVELSKEIVELRSDCDMFKRSLAPMLEPADLETEECTTAGQ